MSPCSAVILVYYVIEQGTCILVFSESICSVCRLAREESDWVPISRGNSIRSACSGRWQYKIACASWLVDNCLAPIKLGPQRNQYCVLGLFVGLVDILHHPYSFRGFRRIGSFCQLKRSNAKTWTLTQSLTSFALQNDCRWIVTTVPGGGPKSRHRGPPQSRSVPNDHLRTECGDCKVQVLVLHAPVPQDEEDNG